MLFGLNYAGSSHALKGCINDAKKFASYLNQSFVFEKIDVFTDDSPAGVAACSRNGMLASLNKLAQDSYAQTLAFVYIHISSHGSQVADKNRDERDGKDECVVTCDGGRILDDEFRTILMRFRPATQVTIVTDCCHSATMIDAAFAWESRTVCSKQSQLPPTPCNLISLSGCQDVQTAADVGSAYGSGVAGGALTSALLEVLKADLEVNVDVFKVLERVRVRLAAKTFQQKPVLCTSRDIGRTPTQSFIAASRK